MANFLCTKQEAAEVLSQDLLAPYPALPHALPPTGSTNEARQAIPLYYLPYKLLPWQADQIDAQVEDMKTELDKEQSDWSEDLARRDSELSEMRSKLNEMNAASARENGQEVKRTRLRHDDEDDQHGQSSSNRAPLPERERSQSDMDESDEGRNLNHRSRSGSAARVDLNGDDVVECEAMNPKLLPLPILICCKCRLKTELSWLTCWHTKIISLRDAAGAGHSSNSNDN